MKNYVADREDIMREIFESLGDLKVPGTEAARSLLQIDVGTDSNESGLALIEKKIKETEDMRPIISYLTSFLQLKLHEDANLRPLVSSLFLKTLLVR